jgi:two-component system response regulator AgrA
MMDVYVCEDLEEQREAIADYIQNVIMMQGYDMNFRLATDDPEKLIESLKLSKHTGIYFLDIDLHTGQNGLALAKEIRDYDQRGFIVFLTAHSEMSFLTFQYKVEALDFILKDNYHKLKNQISECLEYAMQKHRRIMRGVGKTFTIKRNGREMILAYDTILFFETSVNEHRLIVHTIDKNIEFFGKMKEIEKETEGDFIRCHRAYLVNRKNIKEINYAEKIIIMKNNVSCPISGRLLGKLKRFM